MKNLQGLRRHLCFWQRSIPTCSASNGMTWWQGYVRFLNFAGQPFVKSGMKLVQVDVPAKGRAGIVQQSMIGMFGACPNHSKYTWILVKGYVWSRQEIIEKVWPLLPIYEKTDARTRNLNS